MRIQRERESRGDRSPAYFLVEPLEGRQLLASSVSGMVFNDADADGVRKAGEAGLARQRVFIDTNFDGKFQAGEPNQLTKSTGAYSFANLGAGVYRIRVIAPSGNRQTSPASGYYDVAANGADIHAANDFGLTTTAVVRGNVTNGSGVKDLTEQGVSGVLAYIDKNRNGKLDAGEKSRRTDINGNWRFAGLPAGTYVIRVAPPQGVTVTAPLAFFRLKLKAAQSLSNRNMGLKV